MWALGYLLVAVGIAGCLYFGLRRPVRAFLKFRGAMVVTCPETAQPAGVKMDARRASRAAPSVSSHVLTRQSHSTRTVGNSYQ